MEKNKQETAFAPLPPELEAAYVAELEKCSIHVLRGFGRVLGVRRSSSLDKAACLTAIADVRFGRVEPYFTPVGPHPKNDWTGELLKFEARAGFRIAVPNTDYEQVLSDEGLFIKDSVKQNDLYGYVYVEENGAKLYPEKYVFTGGESISSGLCRQYGLRTGDTMQIKRFESQTEVVSVNGRNPLSVETDRWNFAKEPAVYPSEGVDFAGGKYTAGLKKHCPISRGQRALAVYGGLDVKTAFFREMAGKLRESFRGDYFVGVSLECRSEEASALAGEFDDFAAVEFGADPFDTVRASEMAFGMASRNCEKGRNAVVLFDNFDELLAAYAEVRGSRGEALRALKKLFMSAKATEKTALTLIALAGEELARELTGGANAVIRLDENGVTSDSFVVNFSAPGKNS